MGLAYTIDSPIKVARFGISSVISIIEDRLIEMMRKHYYPFIGKAYEPITMQEPDYRAKRISDYLNLVKTIVDEQMQRLRSEPFEQGSDIVKYFEMLPSGSRVRRLYDDMNAAIDAVDKGNRQAYLRTLLRPGSIDVNILTKADREHRDKLGNIIPDGSDAVAALRGYIASDLTDSSIVFSAGFNPRLYSYLERVNAFDPDEQCGFRKKVIVKVSDYRSALIQGKFLAKKGIWVSEFRIESGLNCGGHAFATDGYLLGPVLEEFKMRRQELMDHIFAIYNPVILARLGFSLSAPPQMGISVQGGIGTHEEDTFLHTYYEVSSTGWGTPFLLVPEATTVDPQTLDLLTAAREGDVVLSDRSPVGIPFYYLKGTTADVERRERVASGTPGSPCTERHLALNTEFTEEPICTASHRYQKLKIEHLQSLQLPEEEFERQHAAVVAKECLCVGLSNAASLCYQEPLVKSQSAVNICPGPNIANFSKTVSLKTMIDHIYGRMDIISNPHRVHMFIAEMHLYLSYLKMQLGKEQGIPLEGKRKSWYQTFVSNLTDAIAYYQSLPEQAIAAREAFDRALSDARRSLASLMLEYSLD